MDVGEGEPVAQGFDHVVEASAEVRVAGVQRQPQPGVGGRLEEDLAFLDGGHRVFVEYVLHTEAHAVVLGKRGDGAADAGGLSDGLDPGYGDGDAQVEGQDAGVDGGRAADGFLKPGHGLREGEHAEVPQRALRRVVGHGDAECVAQRPDLIGRIRTFQQVGLRDGDAVYRGRAPFDHVVALLRRVFKERPERLRLRLDLFAPDRVHDMRSSRSLKAFQEYRTAARGPSGEAPAVFREMTPLYPP